METQSIFKLTLVDRFIKEAEANVGDAPYVVRILKRAIASLEKELTAEWREREQEMDDEEQARMIFRADRMLQGILDSMDFTFNGANDIQTLYANKQSRPKFTPYAKTVIQRTYSGEKDKSGVHETWADIVIRVIETVFYFRKVQLLSLENDLHPTAVFSRAWDEGYEQNLARRMAISMYNVEWLPPGRGLQMCRKKLIQRRGSMILNNCGFVSTGYCNQAQWEERGTAAKRRKLQTYAEGKKAFPYGLPEMPPDERQDAVHAFLDAMEWGSTALMSGVGVGFDTHVNLLLEEPLADAIETYVVPDTREGWSYSIRLLFESYVFRGRRTMAFDYSKVRPKGALIRSFGGTASGPGALRLCHERIRASCRCLRRCQTQKKKEGEDDREAIATMLRERLPHELAYLEEEDPSLVNSKRNQIEGWITAVLNSPFVQTYGTTRACIDWCNFIGVCVRMGNLRRSAEIILGSPDDEELFDAKDYEKHPDRMDVGNTSNNSLQLYDEDQYQEAARKLSRVVGVRGEPGIVNMVHIWDKPPIIRSPYSGEKDIELEIDGAEGMNPCGETPLESYELCDLVETYPCNAPNHTQWLWACRYAAIFGSVVSCIPTASEATNRVVSRNHRIGVSQTGLFQLYEQCVSGADYEDRLRAAYRMIREVADEYVIKITGVRPIRVTAVKPSGTIAPLGNAPPGIHPPIESRYVIRRIRIARNKPISAILQAKGIPYEVDVYDPTAYVFDFVLDQGDMRTAEHITMWELGSLAMCTQRHYADLAVSLSLYVDKHADTPDQIYAYLKRYLHKIKSISFMPQSTKKALPLNNGTTLFFPMFADHVPMFHRLQSPPSVTDEMLLKCAILFPTLLPFLQVTKEAEAIRGIPISEDMRKECIEKAPEFLPLLSYVQASNLIDDHQVEEFENMPRFPYAQPPYEPITAEEYARLTTLIGDLDFDGTPFDLGEQDIIQGCDGLKCSRE